MGDKILNINRKKTFGAPGPEEMDIMSSVHCSILIKALTYLYTKFGQESFIYTVANAQTNLYIAHISKKAT